MLPGEQGPCVVRPLLCVHNDPLPVSCVGQRLKPGQCLSLETCGTAFTNLGWIQTKMFLAISDNEFTKVVAIEKNLKLKISLVNIFNVSC